ncbi:MAG: hypothetical protein ACYTGL_06555 [Planctomycetota bacterium]|jgi:hypothetical protein
MVTGSFTTAIVLAAVLSPHNINCTGEGSPTFKSAGGLVTGKGVSSDLSEDGKAITHIFDSAIVDTDAHGVGTKILTIRSPLNSHNEPVAITQDFRGVVSRDPGTKASLVVVVAGTTHTLSLPCPGDGEFKDFDVRVTTVVPPGSDYVATISLVTHNLSGKDDHGAKLDLDSLDLEIRGVVCRPQPCCCR